MKLDSDQMIRAVFDKLEQQSNGFGFFRLDENHNVVGCSAFEAMEASINDAARRVGLTTITEDISVSTVFMGGFLVPKDRGKRLFETMILGGPRDGYTLHYATWEEAARGHKAAVLLAGGEIK